MSVQVSTDWRTLVHWLREDIGTIIGPVGHRGRWHELLSQFQLEVEYKKGSDKVGADAMSHWAFAACQHAPDACLHGSEEDMKKVQRDIQDERELQHHVLAHNVSCLAACEHTGLFALCLPAIPLGAPGTSTQVGLRLSWLGLILELLLMSARTLIFLLWIFF